MVAPVDHSQDDPADAVSITESPGHTVALPLTDMVAGGPCITFPTKGTEVPLQPFVEFVTITEYGPVPDIYVVCKVDPFDHK